jgi:hypothetical protein
MTGMPASSVMMFEGNILLLQVSQWPPDAGGQPDSTFPHHAPEEGRCDRGMLMVRHHDGDGIDPVGAGGLGHPGKVGIGAIRWAIALKRSEHSTILASE